MDKDKPRSDEEKHAKVHPSVSVLSSVGGASVYFIGAAIHARGAPGEEGPVRAMELPGSGGAQAGFICCILFPAFFCVSCLCLLHLPFSSLTINNDIMKIAIEARQGRRDPCVRGRAARGAAGRTPRRAFRNLLLLSEGVFVFTDTDMTYTSVHLYWWGLCCWKSP